MHDFATALVTGGASGIGRATARRLHADGMKVWIADLNEEGARSAAFDIGSGERTRTLTCDVTDRRSVESVINAIFDEDGRIDVVCANAGVSSMQPFLELSEEEWDRNLTVNATGAFLTIQAAAKRMVQQAPRQGRPLRGKVVATASMAARQGAPFLAHYSASKFAVIGLVHAVAKELAPHGITVNAINPGYVRTSMQDREIRWEGTLRGMAPEDVLADYVRQTPLGRLEEPDDVAAVVSFLAGPDSDFLTGESVEINGGAFIF